VPGGDLIRTQIGIKADEYKLAQQAARDAGKWMRSAGMVESGNPACSQSIDEIVYGHKD
jgi:hypothetical protein